MNEPIPFTIEVADSVLSAVREKVVAYPWHEMPVDGGWAFGANMDYMKALVDYWVKDFDWRAQERVLNRFPQYTARVDGIEIHFIREIGSGQSPVPLIISHGWPGSVAEFTKIIEPLAHPERFGGDPEHGFTVIAPSLPGFGFSGKPPRPWGPRKMAAILNSLMTDVLGFSNYIAQGGDWGGAISSWLGFEHPACKAIHINILTMRHPDGPQTPEEQAWLDQFIRDQEMEDGYRTQQATRPQTLSYAMMDSPVGVAAWIMEKFHSWSDTRDGGLDRVYTMDELLTNIMIYVVTRTFNTASWIYYGRREEGGRILSSQGRRVEVPTGCAVFPEEMLAWPPRTYVERIYNVQHWTEMPRGGHFAAMEQPELLVSDLRDFVGKIELSR